MHQRDPYFYDDIDVLKNLLGITDEKLLEQAESDIAYVKLLDVDICVTTEIFDFQHLQNLHKYIFGDIYPWAGTSVSRRQYQNNYSICFTVCRTSWL